MEVQSNTNFLGLGSEVQLIEAEWCIYASEYKTIISSYSGVPHARRQAIIWTNAVLLLTGSLGSTSGAFLIEIHSFLLTKTYLKVVWKVATIFPWSQ